MTFSEMRHMYDKFHAFDNYITVESAKTLGIIPEGWHSYFPDRCKCGSENIVTMSLSSIMCTDPRCPCKQALGLSELFSRFGCVGVGEATCQELYSLVHNLNDIEISKGRAPILSSNSYIEIIGINTDILPISYRMSAKFDVLVQNISSILESSYTFPDLVSRLGLPEIGTSAFKLLADTNSFDELIQTINSEGGISAFCDNRHCYDAMKKFYLNISLEDIGVAVCLFGQTIRKAGKIVEEICITGSCYVSGSRMTKKTFIDLCNRHGFARPIAELIAPAIDTDAIYGVETVKMLNKNYNVGLEEVEQSGKNILESLSGNISSVRISVIEVQMSSAKMSVPYIVADVPSSSSKYLAGLSRGVEIDSDGIKRKVLITSDEYLRTIDSRVSNWEREVTENCRSLIEKMKYQSSNLMILKNLRNLENQESLENQKSPENQEITNQMKQF